MQTPEEEGLWEIGQELVFIFIFHKGFFYLYDFCLTDSVLKDPILECTIMARDLSISRTEAATMGTWFQPETRFASREWRQLCAY